MIITAARARMPGAHRPPRAWRRLHHCRAPQHNDAAVADESALIAECADVVQRGPALVGLEAAAPVAMAARLWRRPGIVGDNTAAVQ